MMPILINIKRKSESFLVAFVDDEDYERVYKFRWNLLRARSTNYAINPQIGLMHRLVMSPSKNHDIHHSDGNGLNNVKSNLKELPTYRHMLIHKILREGGFDVAPL